MSALEAKITITAVDRVSSVVKGISKSLEGITKATSNLGNSWNRLAAASGDLVSRVRNIALVTVAAGTSIYGLTSHYAKYAEELGLSSVRTGVAIENLQKLGYATNLTGISTDSLNTSLKFLNRSISVAASNPMSEQAAAFRSMGISVKDVNGNLRDVNEVLLEVSARFEKSTDAAKNTATSMTLLGRSGTELVPFLRLGPDRIAKLGAEFSRIGHVWTEPQRKLGEAFDDSLDKMKVSITGFASLISIKLFPVLQPLIESLTEWIVANRELLSIKMAEGITKLGNALQFVWQMLERIYDAISPVIDAFGGLKAVLIFLASLYIARFVVSVGQTIAALLSFANAIRIVTVAMLTNPIGLFIGALSLVGYGIYQLIKHWDALKAVMIKIWPDVQPFVEFFLNVVTLGMYTAVKTIIGNWDKIKPYLTALWKWMSDSADAVFMTIGSFFSGMVDSVLGMFGTNMDAVAEKFSGVMDSMRSAVTTFLDLISIPFKAVYALFEKVVNGVKSVRQSLGGASVPEVKSTGNIMPSEISPVRQNLPTPFSAVAEGGKNILQSSGGESASLTTQQNSHLDINMTIDYEGRPTKVTAKSPNTPINFSASVGKMV